MNDRSHPQISSADLAEAAATGKLHLNGRDIEELPDWIGELPGLQELRLAGNRLRRLPATIGALTNLRTLWLYDNELTELPPEIGALSSLEDLWLDGNQLAGLPSEIGRLSKLTQLRLSDNELATLPPQIGHLHRLETLRLDGNRLDQLPGTIGDLAKLHELSVANNELTSLPSTIGQLSELRDLALDGNELTELPPTIGHLTQLRELRLDDNKLTRLPLQLAGPLRKALVTLSVVGNPLVDPLPQLFARGLTAVTTYLEGLGEEVSLYEAKVLLVGEGGVGKSSVLAALRGEPFDPGRLATHGIDIAEVDVAKAGGWWDLLQDQPRLILRFWDFGGQHVYRVSNQFFYSSRALFLLTWSARLGADHCDIPGWLRRIRARAGEYAQVVLVGTNADAPQARTLEPAGLPPELAGMVQGSYLAENSSGRGIPELARAIVEHTSGLEHLGTILPPEWAAVRLAVDARADEVPILSRHEYLSICERKGIVDADAQDTLAALMHDLGQVIYHGHVDGLRDTMVLDPEWLAKAIGAILTDKATVEADGVLDHARLPRIWSDRRRPAYPREQHPFLLRLMEEFDISWRLEDGRHSLIAPLVPDKRPMLPWTTDTPLPEGVHRLRVQASFLAGSGGAPGTRIAPAPGLISALTVRHHLASANKHWRSGVFLHHPNPQLDSTALIELQPVPGTTTLSDDVAAQVMVEVRGPDPAFFFHVLVESVDTLRRQRWPGLSLDLDVPCPGRLDDGTPCTNLFSLAVLRRRRAENRRHTECQTCNTDHDTAELLTGFAGVVEGLVTPQATHDEAAIIRHLEDLAAEVKTMHEDVYTVGLDVRNVRGDLATATKGLFHVLLAVNTLVRDVPRLFTVAALPSAASGWRRHQDSFELMLWCEHQGEYHPVPEATYMIRRPKKWLRTVQPYVRLILGALKPFLPLVASVAEEILPEGDVKAVQRHLDVIKAVELTVFETSDIEDEALEVFMPSDIPQPAIGAALRAFRSLILELVPSRVFPGLDTFLAPSGEVVWVCARHAPIYRPEPIRLS